MAIGGFNGSDPSPTLAEFQADVARGEIHYYVATRDAAGFQGTRGGSDVGGRDRGVGRTHFEATSIGGATVYDLSQPT